MNNKKTKRYSDEWKAKISFTLTGREIPKEVREKISKVLKGRKLTKKWKRKIALANTGKKRKGIGGVKKGTIPWNKGLNRNTDNRVIYGKKHSKWKGGAKTESLKIRQSFEYTLWRKAVFERDSFTCQKYGTVGFKLEAHHINNFADFPELRLAIDNGITLSKKAHNEFHKKYGKHNNTSKQLEEFLKYE